MPRFRELFTLLGFSFWQAWQVLVMHAGALVGVSQNGLVLQIGTKWLFLITTLAIPIIAFIRHKQKRTDNRPLYYTVATCAFFGTIIIALSSRLTEFSFEVYIFGVVLYAISNGFILMLWGEYWSTCGLGWVSGSLCLSYTVAFLMFLMLRMLPWVMLVLVISMLLPLSVIALAMDDGSEKRKHAPSPFETTRPQMVKMLVFIFVASMAFGFGQVHFEQFIPTIYPDLVLSGYIALLLGFIVFTASLFINTAKSELIHLYQPIIPTIVAGLILMTLLSPDLQYLAFGLLMFGIFCLDILIMMVATDLAMRTNRSVALVFGTAFFISRLGSASSNLVSSELIFAGYLSAAEIVTILLIVVLSLVIVGMVVFPLSSLILLFQSKPKFEAADMSCKTPIEIQCSIISRDFGLTNRESEILLLLAKGRNIPYISESLIISGNTTKRHVSNIYRKLCVYTRQGLHDLIEGYQANDVVVPQDMNRSARL